MTTNQNDRFSQKGKKKEINGTILLPQVAGLRFILNYLSMSGKPSGDLMKVLDRKWPKIKAESKGWFASRENFKLGSISITAVQSDTWVITMLCQDESGTLNSDALDSCLKRVHQLAKQEKASIHVSQFLVDQMPEINAKLDDVMINDGVSVSIYMQSF